MPDKSEPARQFDEIWEEWNDPEERAKKKLLKNREEREKLNREDLGL